MLDGGAVDGAGALERRVQPLQTTLQDAKVDKGQLQVHGDDDVLRRLGAGGDVLGVVKCADDVDEGVGLLHQVQQLAAHAAASLASAAHRRGVDVLDLSRHDTLGLEHLGQRHKARVGHLRDAHAAAGPSARRSLTVGQRVEQGRLSALRKAEDQEVHCNSSRSGCGASLAMPGRFFILNMHPL